MKECTYKQKNNKELNAAATILKEINLGSSSHK